MKYKPTIKIGFAETFEEAMNIINHSNLLQDHGVYFDGKKIEPTPVCVVPDGSEIKDGYVAHNLKEFKIRVIKGIATNGKIHLMEVDEIAELEL